MHYLVHLRNVNYEIYSKNTPAIYWYENAPLTFEVITHTGWGDNKVLVSINGKELAQNADGTSTIPGGTGYVQINAYPATQTAEHNTQGESHSDVCGYCGKVHPSSLWGRIVAFFHALILFFTRLFNK
jgi:hypothetical protein